MSHSEDTERWQEIIAINCPICGEIMKIACPKSNTRVDRVRVRRGYSSTEDDNPDDNSECACLKSEGDLPFYVWWWYYKPQF